MRVLIHAQHLSGVGHLVRGQELARALVARGHDVTCVAGGRPVPRPPLPGVARLELPVLRRHQGELAGEAARARLPALLDARRRRLRQAATILAPDVLVLEHFPFSKWDLEHEYLALISAVRAARPDARVVCSVRDVCRQTRHEPVPPEAWRARVLELLRAHFDLLLIHSDPRFTGLGEHFVAPEDVGIAVEHTGFVSQPLPEVKPASRRRAPHDVLSTGGAAGATGLACLAARAWARSSAARDGRLVIYTGLDLDDDQRRALADVRGDAAIEVREFGSGFLACLAGARLSLGRAGYNSCTNLLATRRRALLVPDPAMSDQGPRALRLAERGLAVVLEEAGLDEAALIAGIERALAAPPPEHDLRLDGAERSAELLERLLLERLRPA